MPSQPRILLFSDVHGDLAALDYLLALPADKRVCLGDLVAYGPRSRECVLRVRDAPGLVVLKGNWDAVVAGESTANPEYADALTAQALIVALIDFYSKPVCLAAAGSGTTLLSVFQDARDLGLLPQIAFQAVYAEIETLPSLLRQSSPPLPAIQYLDGLPLLHRVPDLDLVAVHGGLPGPSSPLGAAYHYFCDTREKAQGQVCLAREHYGCRRIAHGHTHCCRILAQGQYLGTVPWDVPFPWDGVSYVSLPAAGRYRKTGPLAEAGYAIIEGTPATITFRRLALPSASAPVLARSRANQVSAHAESLKQPPGKSPSGGGRGSASGPC